MKAKREVDLLLHRITTITIHINLLLLPLHRLIITIRAVIAMIAETLIEIPRDQDHLPQE